MGNDGQSHQEIDGMAAFKKLQRLSDICQRTSAGNQGWSWAVTVQTPGKAIPCSSLSPGRRGLVLELVCRGRVSAAAVWPQGCVTCRRSADIQDLPAAVAFLKSYRDGSRLSCPSDGSCLGRSRDKWWGFCFPPGLFYLSSACLQSAVKFYLLRTSWHL